MDFVSLMAEVPKWLNAFTTLVTVATGITMLTPTKADDKYAALILKVLNVMAGNVLKNRNADG